MAKGQAPSIRSGRHTDPSLGNSSKSSDWFLQIDGCCFCDELIQTVVNMFRPHGRSAENSPPKTPRQSGSAAGGRWLRVDGCGSTAAGRRQGGKLALNPVVISPATAPRSVFVEDPAVRGSQPAVYRLSADVVQLHQQHG
eukprot:superscaffoldBa00006263_g21327